MLEYLTTNIGKRAEYPRASISLAYSSDATISTVDPVWLVAVERRINQLLTMRENWDSFGAPRIEFEAAMGALMFLMQNALHDMPAPQVVPMSNGGVQVEWHLRGTNLELSFVPAEPASFSFSDGQLDHEGHIDQNFLLVTSLLRGLPLEDVFSEHNG